MTEMDTRRFRLSSDHPRRCRARSKRSGKRCGKFAMKGKDVCSFHGGKTPIRHGLYSKYVGAGLGQRIRELESDAELLDLRRQVAILQALQTRQLGKVASLETIPEEDLEITRRLTDSVIRAIERYERVHRAPENWVPIELVGRIVHGFAEAINIHVREPHARRRILEALQRSVQTAVRPSRLQIDEGPLPHRDS